jgi:OOP family OmpA-OmpF porin
MKSTSQHRLAGHFVRLALVSAVGLAGNAFAQQSPFYIGAAIGSSQYEFDFRGQVRELSTGSLPVTRASLKEDTDTGYKLTLGYQFTSNIAVELDYVDLGKIGSSYEFNGFGRYTRDATYKVSGFNLSGVFLQPVNEQFSVYARAGMLYSKYRYSESGENFPAFNPSPEPPIHSFSAPDLKRAKFSYGLGVGYKVTPAISLRLGVDRYTEIGNVIAPTETGNGKFDNVDLYSLGIVFKF